MQKEQLDRLKAWFNEYVSGFYGDDRYVNANLKLKENHTYRVCRETKYLTDTLDLNENDCLIAQTTALFHDVGRFPQFIRYRTYTDHKSTNHSLLALEVLRENKVLDELPPRESQIIQTAIELHGTIRLPDSLDESVDLFAKLLRDADKLDIYYVVVDYYEKYYADPENFPLEVEFPDLPTCSPKILQAVINGELVDYSELKTLNDTKLLQLGWVYDINFPQTLKKVKENQFLEQLIAFLPQNTDIANVAKSLSQYVDSRINHLK